VIAALRRSPAIGEIVLVRVLGTRRCAEVVKRGRTFSGRSEWFEAGGMLLYDEGAGWSYPEESAWGLTLLEEFQTREGSE
jgi:hypothetical protein